MRARASLPDFELNCTTRGFPEPCVVQFSSFTPCAYGANCGNLEKKRGGRPWPGVVVNRAKQTCTACVTHGRGEMARFSKRALALVWLQHLSASPRARRRGVGEVSARHPALDEARGMELGHNRHLGWRASGFESGSWEASSQPQRRKYLRPHKLQVFPSL